MSFPKTSELYEDPLRKTLIGHSSQSIRSTRVRVSVHNVQDQPHIEWSNLIFLQFHPVFRMIIVVVACIKAMMGPIQSVYPIVYCNDVMDHHALLISIKYFYFFCCDALYAIDTFLHMVHRQVVDKAMRREYLPKSAIWLICDLLSLIPFFRLIITDPCATPRIWPNILLFNEFLVIYRVIQFFSLGSSHSYPLLLLGYWIVMVLCINCIACFLLLATYQGFCDHCNNSKVYYDWRSFIWHKFNGTDEGFATYIYASVFVYSFAVNGRFEEIMPSAILEFIMVCIFMVAGYVITNFIIIPKAIHESILRFRRVCEVYSRVTKVIQETKRRNPDDNSHEIVQTYYKLLWRRRSGIANRPQFVESLPRYLRLFLSQDLLWPLFYHSPTLRKTSYPFRRWLTELTIIYYKLPGEKFFTGPNNKGHLYYLKSGIVQLISVDDGVTPILSVTSGTIFGDIHFYVPPLTRKVIARCLTYCEYYFVDRQSMIRSLHKYPSDRRIVMNDVKNRLDHAKLLFSNKNHIRGLDRNEDEGISWLKKRWWELLNIVENYSKTTGHPKEALGVILPPDEALYHCSKYIGQLVLCNKTELRTKSMFTNFKFPWIINPHSKFGFAWYRIVAVDVFLVLLLYPQCLIKPHIPKWFQFFTLCSDTIYVIDIGISLVTAVKKQDIVTNNFSSVMFERFKSITFILDLISTVWIEDIADLCGASQYYYTLQFNRLIKIYVLFCGEYLKFDIRSDPVVDVCRVIAFLHFAFFIVSSNMVLEMHNYFPALTMDYFFGEKLCIKAHNEDCTHTPIFGAAISWAFEWTCSSQNRPQTLEDLEVACCLGFIGYIIVVYCKARFISYLYLVNKNQIKYQSFVLHLKAYYQHYRIHNDLLKRLDRYLKCHWKYYKGTDVLEPNKLENEAREIFWKAQGNLAESIITNSKAFKHVDPKLIRGLARATYFLMLPRSSSILMFGIQSKHVTWVVQVRNGIEPLWHRNKLPLSVTLPRYLKGYVKCEYVDENGEMFTDYLGPGRMLSICEVFLEKASLRSYTSVTECEIMFIRVKDFFDIYKKYPIEYSFVETCVEEFREMFNEIFKKNILNHRDYLSKLKEMTDEYIRWKRPLRVIGDIKANRSLPVEGILWGDPESGFMQSWMLFRVVIVCVSITTSSILGGVGASSRWILAMISTFCDLIAFVDIIIKCCLPYYDYRGVYITDKRKCLKNYLTKGFALDLIGAAPWFSILKALLYREITDDTGLLINTVSKFAHLYILFAYFGYITDIPTVNLCYAMIIKWQIVIILMVLGMSHYLMTNCVHFEFNEMKDLTSISLKNKCWMPKIFELPKTLNGHQLHLIFAQSLSLVQYGMMRMSVGKYSIDRSYLGLGVCLFALGILFWFITCYTLTLLMLKGRGDTVFQHSVYQLERFLKSERVEKEVIEKVMEHFRYCWMRTKGVNIEQLTNARIGVMFRQDLSYYFYKKTLSILDSIIGGGETMQRQLAGVCNVAYFLPGYDIFREMDIVSDVFIVHRGRINVFKDGKQIIILTKGDIFGQLEGLKLRPIRVTARADGHVDLLFIKATAFQSTITEEMKVGIGKSRQAKNDFMATRNIFNENPYDTVQYLLRGCKTISLPWSDAPMEAHRNVWYTRWLYLAWLIGPFASSCLVLIFIFLPADSALWLRFYCAIFVTDAVDIINFVAEFYTIELVVLNNKCIHRRLGMKRFRDWGLYLDALSLIVPLMTIFTNDWKFQTARLLRLKFFIDFEYHFCRDFRSQKVPYILKIAIILLLVHLFTCGWILFACQDEQFPLNIADTSHLNASIDFSQWLQPKHRKGGCARTSAVIDETGVMNSYFVVPKFWGHDYVVALTFILLIHTRTSLDTIIAMSLKQIYYQVFITYFMYLLDMWIMAVAINIAMNKYRVFYQYEYNVQSMLNYWTDNGIYKSLIEMVKSYTDHVWKRQKGDWLPELAYRGPLCLRQDLFTALYIHHLEAAPTFRQLPDYFKRQLCARFYRVVIFPGKCIVREGDIFTTTYFIHEGEVEKWCTDASGEGQLVSILYTNGFFGCVAGLFPNASFRYSYYTRTVVDLMYLSLPAWEDLLESYPDVKTKLYDITTQMIKDAQYIGAVRDPRTMIDSTQQLDPTLGA